MVSSIPELVGVDMRDDISIVDSNGHVKRNEVPLPRSGKYFVEFLRRVDLDKRSVLDVGTGYFGFIARHAEQCGASKVVAVDLNESAISSAQKQESHAVDYRISDVYSNIQHDELFDVIVSNPPQLPESAHAKMHDAAGEDGLAVVRKIISGFREHATEKGVLYLLLFDFLFEKVSTLAQASNVSCEIASYYIRPIRRGGETERSMAVLKKIYPTACFEKTEQGFTHKVFILKLQRL